MDKPITMPVREYIARTMSIKNNVPLATIEAIIAHQFEEANKAMLTNNSVEIAGFGKFLFKLKKAHKKLEKGYSKKAMFESKLNEPDITEAKKISYTLKLSNTIKEIEILTAKLNGGIRKDMGRVEEQPITPKGDKREDSNNIISTSGNM
jgi:nucleoid DNA-binding protein